MGDFLRKMTEPQPEDVEAAMVGGELTGEVVFDSMGRMVWERDAVVGLHPPVYLDWEDASGSEGAEEETDRNWLADMARSNNDTGIVAPGGKL